MKAAGPLTEDETKVLSDVLADFGGAVADAAAINDVEQEFAELIETHLSGIETAVAANQPLTQDQANVLADAISDYSGRVEDYCEDEELIEFLDKQLSGIESKLLSADRS